VPTKKMKKDLNIKVYEVLAMFEVPIEPTMNLYEFAELVMYEMAKTDSKWLDFPHSQRHRYNKIFNHIYKYTYQLIWGRLEST